MASQDMLPLAIPKGVKKGDYAKHLRYTHGIYYVVHIPTNAVYVGVASDLANAYYQWRGRLASVYGQPPLNVAMRALYDEERKLVDWAFYVAHRSTVEEIQGGAIAARVDTIIAALRSQGRAMCLNVTNARSERLFWETQAHGTPTEIANRMAAPAVAREVRARLRVSQPVKVKLKPGRLRPGGRDYRPDVPSVSANLRRYEQHARDFESRQTKSVQNLLRDQRQANAEIVANAEKATLSNVVASGDGIAGYYEGKAVYYLDWPGEIPDGAMRGGDKMPK